MDLPFPVVLASGSPRRQELLAKIVGQFSVEISHMDEEALTVLDPWETAIHLAEAKALAVTDARNRRGEKPAIVIAGDTVVALLSPDGPVQLGKPRDPTDAVRMLRLLSSQRHAVITGLVVSSPRGRRLAIDTAWVRFRSLADHEIERYVETGEPMDKAGAYAIQGGAAAFVENLEGNRETVIGLPTELLRQMLQPLIQSEIP